MAQWKYEVIDSRTNEIVASDNGFISESEAEFFARMDADHMHLEHYYVRTTDREDNN